MAIWVDLTEISLILHEIGLFLREMAVWVNLTKNQLILSWSHWDQLVFARDGKSKIQNVKMTPHEICLCFVWEYSPGEKTGPFRCTSKICKILSDWTSHGVSKVLTGSFLKLILKAKSKFSPKELLLARDGNLSRSHWNQPNSAWDRLVFARDRTLSIILLKPAYFCMS